MSTQKNANQRTLITLLPSQRIGHFRTRAVIFNKQNCIEYLIEIEENEGNINEDIKMIKLPDGEWDGDYSVGAKEDTIIEIKNAIERVELF